MALPIAPIKSIKKTARQSLFDKLYSQLNPQQKQAVDTIEGPVMVIAGPGTGKTQVLTLRIANILRKTQMNPRNILALTFTDAAAQNMRRRLVSIIGPNGYGVAIQTFHSFANLVISEFSYKFQFAKELQSIDQVEQIELVESVLDRLPLEELRPPRAPYHYLREVISQISVLKRENFGPKDLRQLANSESERLTKDPVSYHEKGAHRGKMKAAISEELKQLARCQELSNIYEEYQRLLIQRGRYDYDDMILFVIHQFENDPELKAYYQERFQYLLVDEYQDNNNSQNRLVELLADFYDNPNLFVVGDDRQSIFRFQGASMANLVLFYQRYPQIKVINLPINYRSPQVVLDHSQQVINQTNERLSQFISNFDDRLVAHKVAAGDNAPVALGAFASPDTEAYWIVTQIKKLVEQGTNPHEIAIIYKENREAELFSQLLSRQGISFSLERGSNVLADIDTQRLLMLLRAVAQPTDSQALFSVMHFDCSGINRTDLLKLMALRVKNHQSIIDVIANLPCNCQRHAKKDEIERISLNECGKIDSFLDQLAAWRSAANNQVTPDVIEQILRESGLLRQITDKPDRIECLHRLRRFLEEARRLNIKQPGLTLDQWLDYIERLTQHNLQLVPESLPISDQLKSVRLMTAHKAKGLEFEYVFMPNLVDKHWGNATRRQLIKLPGSIVPRPLAAQNERNEDDRRLFYVALTRAKQQVYLTYATTQEGREQLPSQYVAELDKGKLGAIDAKTASSQAGQHLLAWFSPVNYALFSDQEQEYLSQRIKEHALSPTGLNSYLRCPRDYFYKHLLQVPSPRTAQQAYGLAVHSALGGFFSEHKATHNLPPVGDLITDFVASLQQQGLSTTEYQAFETTGRQVLTAYYDKHCRVVSPTVMVEYSFASHHVVLPGPDGDILLTGILDKLELVDPQQNTVRIIDYKTSRARSRNEIEGKTLHSLGNYKRQLVFYQLLSELDPQFPYKVTELALAFIDDDGHFPIERFTITNQEKEELKAQIRDVYRELQSLEFPHRNDPQGWPCDLCSLLI